MTTLLTTALLAGAVAAAIAAAPVAAADSRSPDGGGTSSERVKPGPKAGQNPLSSDFTAGLPNGWKNEALWARPGPAGGNPFGKGPKPPVVALD